MAKKKLSRDQKRKQKLQKRPHTSAGAERQNAAEKLLHDSEHIIYETFISYGRGMLDADVLEAVNQLTVDIQHGDISKQDASLESPNAKGALVWNIKQRWTETRALETMPHLVAAQAMQALAQRVDGIMAPGESHSYLRFLQGGEQTAVLAAPAGATHDSTTDARGASGARDAAPGTPEAGAAHTEQTGSALQEAADVAGTVGTADAGAAHKGTEGATETGAAHEGAASTVSTSDVDAAHQGAAGTLATSDADAAREGAAGTATAGAARGAAMAVAEPHLPNGDWSDEEKPLLAAGLTWLRGSSEESWKPFAAEAARLTEGGHAQAVANVSQYLYGLVRADAVELALRPVLDAAHAKFGAEIDDEAGSNEEPVAATEAKTQPATEGKPS